MVVTEAGRCTVVNLSLSRNASSGMMVTSVSLISNTSNAGRLFLTKLQSFVVILPFTFSTLMDLVALPVAAMRSFNSPPLGLSMVNGLAVNATSSVPIVVSVGMVKVPSSATLTVLSLIFTEIRLLPSSGIAFSVVALPWLAKNTSPFP